jgi:hypothetical protein
MKRNLMIIRNEIISRFEKDRAAWFYIGLRYKRTGIQAADLVEFSKMVNQQFPELPSKMVWGNYLIPDIDENDVNFQIDASPEKISEIEQFITQQALEQGFAVLVGEKILRPSC